MTYNVLCEKYATPQQYGYTPSWALDWNYRKERILGEIALHGPDLVCLQVISTLFPFIKIIYLGNRSWTV